MSEQKFCKEIEIRTEAVENEKRVTNFVIEPMIFKIQQRNHRVKLAMANKLLALGLKKKSVESILHISF